jgi:2-phosphosulfolactate phosphatase
MARSVVIDVGPPCARRFGADDAVVVVDVIRSMTTAVSVAAAGGRCLPVPTVMRARSLARVLPRPLLAGEISGVRPPGFHFSNSPVEVMRAPDLRDRAVVLLSSSGTPLIEEVRRAGACYPACLRNRSALAAHLAQRHHRVAVMGAATRGAFREEDQLCCAFIAEKLVAAGFTVEDDTTAALIRRWSGAPPQALLVSDSVDWLRRAGALADLQFIFDHVDDVDAVFWLQAGELRPAT